MAASSVDEFDDRLNSAECDSRIRAIVGALRSHVDGCGPVTWLAHKSKSGWGIRASAAGRIVCHIDPKPRGGCVDVQIMEAEPDDLAKAGAVHLRKNAPPWVHVADPGVVAVLLPLVSSAYATAQGRAKAGRPAGARGGSAARSGVPALATPALPAATEEPAGGNLDDVRRQLEALGFHRAGAIRAVDGGRTCVCDVEDARGFLVYAHVVGPTVMKFGITTPSLRSRVSQNAGTINQVLALAAGTATPAAWHSRPFDRFKQLAPEVIRSGREIEIWVLDSSESDYKAVERDLNAKFDTMDKGWTSRLG